MNFGRAIGISSHSVGERLGVRATEKCAQLIRSELKRCTLIRAWSGRILLNPHASALRYTV